MLFFHKMLPNDCISYILEFCKSTEVMINCLLLSKNVYTHLIKDLRRINKNVTYMIKYLKYPVPNWVSGLDIMKIRSTDTKYLTKLEYLHIQNIGIDRYDIVKYLTDCGHNKYEEFSRPDSLLVLNDIVYRTIYDKRKEFSFPVMKNLKIFELDTDILDFKDINNMPMLEVLDLNYDAVLNITDKIEIVNLKRITANIISIYESGYHLLKKITYIKNIHTNGVKECLKILSLLENVDVLSIKCYELKNCHMKYFKNIKDVEILGADMISFEGMIQLAGVEKLCINGVKFSSADIGVLKSIQN